MQRRLWYGLLPLLLTACTGISSKPLLLGFVADPGMNPDVQNRALPLEVICYQLRQPTQQLRTALSHHRVIVIPGHTQFFEITPVTHTRYLACIGRFYQNEHTPEPFIIPIKKTFGLQKPIKIGIKKQKLFSC